MSATFSARTKCSLSLNFSVIYAYRALNVSKGNVAKSSCVTPCCSPSYALGYHMLIGVTVTNLCQFPSGSIIVLGVVDGVATYGAWLTSVFSSINCVSIVYLSASCASVIAVIGCDIVS